MAAAVAAAVEAETWELRPNPTAVSQPSIVMIKLKLKKIKFIVSSASLILRKPYVYESHFIR
jgi:hypothetical protein